MIAAVLTISNGIGATIIFAVALPGIVVPLVIETPKKEN